MQISDIANFGTPIEAAPLLLPRGAKLLAATAEVEQLPPRDTMLGTVEIPPKTYYRYVCSRCALCDGIAPALQLPTRPSALAFMSRVP